MSVDELQAKSENLKATIEASNTKISELETRAKVLEATVEPSNIEIGELEMRAKALATTVAGVNTAAKNLPLSVEKARNQLPSESVLLDSYIALIGQSKENAVALRSLEEGNPSLWWSHTSFRDLGRFIQLECVP